MQMINSSTSGIPKSSPPEQPAPTFRMEKVKTLQVCAGAAKKQASISHDPVVALTVGEIMLGQLLTRGCHHPPAPLVEYVEHLHTPESNNATNLLELVNTFGTCILLFACTVALINTLLLLASHACGRRIKMVLALTQPGVPVTLDHIKLELGRGIAFALELLVAADVIETLCKPMCAANCPPFRSGLAKGRPAPAEWPIHARAPPHRHELSMEAIYKMLLVGIIRTGLAFFLGREIEARLCFSVTPASTRGPLIRRRACPTILAWRCLVGSRETSGACQAHGSCMHALVL